MKQRIQQWPVWLWLLVYVGSLFAIEATHRSWLAVVAGAMIVVAFAWAAWLAVGRQGDEPRPTLVVLGFACAVAYYVVVAIAAAAAGWKYGLAGLLAGLIPSTAVALMLASARRRTMVSSGNLADAAAEDDSGSPPAQGFDDASPLGSTSEHSTAEGDPAAAARSRRAAARARPAVRFPDQGSR